MYCRNADYSKTPFLFQERRCPAQQLGGSHPFLSWIPGRENQTQTLQNSLTPYAQWTGTARPAPPAAPCLTPRREEVSHASSHLGLGIGQLPLSQTPIVPLSALMNNNYNISCHRELSCIKIQTPNFLSNEQWFYTLSCCFFYPLIFL